MEDLKPSSVFLAMTLDTVKTMDISFERFRILMDTWAQIRELEAMAARAAVIKGLGDIWPAAPVTASKSTPEDAEKVHADDDEKVHVEGVEKVHEDPPDEGVQNGPPEAPARDPSEIGNRSFATRKRNVLARIDELRSAGVTYAQIADAGPGLTINSVLDAVNRNPLPLVTWTALEKAVNALAKQRPLPAAPMKGD